MIFLQKERVPGDFSLLFNSIWKHIFWAYCILHNNLGNISQITVYCEWTPQSEFKQVKNSSHKSICKK